MNELEKIQQSIDNAVTVYTRRTGMTQAELAAKIPLSDLQFGRKRRGEAGWKMAECVRLARLIDIPLSELLGFK